MRRAELVKRGMLDATPYLWGADKVFSTTCMASLHRSLNAAIFYVRHPIRCSTAFFGSPHFASNYFYIQIARIPFKLQITLNSDLAGNMLLQKFVQSFLDCDSGHKTRKAPMNQLSNGPVCDDEANNHIFRNAHHGRGMYNCRHNSSAMELLKQVNHE